MYIWNLPDIICHLLHGAVWAALLSQSATVHLENYADPLLAFWCSVGGVQSQSITVDRQMRRYDVPRVAFINKLDRAGADPWKVLRQMREKLRLNVAAVQVG